MKKGTRTNSHKDDNLRVTDTTQQEERVRLVWHRRDLRLHDNELYADDDSYRNHHHSNCCYFDPREKPPGSTKNRRNDSSLKIISLFVFDNHHFQPQPSSIGGEEKKFHTIWCGPHYTSALIDAVDSLRSSIQLLGGELLVRVGDPIVIVPQIALQIGATEVWYSEEPGTYECQVAKNIQQVCTLQYGIKVCSKVGYTLYHPNDLPWNHNEWSQLAHPKNKQKKKNKRTTEKQETHLKTFLEESVVDVSCDRFTGMCRIMGDFRRAVTSYASVRPIIPAPTELLKPTGYDLLNIDQGRIPTLEDLIHSIIQENNDATSKISIMGMDDETIQFVLKSAIEERNVRHNQRHVSGGYHLCGELAALQRLETFIGNGYAKIANRSLADVSNHNSSRLSTYFALGTLSPRTVYWRAHAAGEGCEWLKSHLEMRDFFLFTCFAAGSKLFQENGMPLSSASKKKEHFIQWNDPTDAAHLQKWKQWAAGKTQLPLIDAGMKELLSTGYCSNRVRQNMASVLTKDLHLDWRAGAEWFQFLLEDHCVGSNYGNWLYFSGVGPDPKNRHFRTVSQMKKYDPKGHYVKKWIPELSNVDCVEVLFRPWDFGIASFQSPIVDPSSQYTWQDWKDIQQTGGLNSEE